METAMRRLNMECIVCMAAYVGTIYMLSFVFMFNRLDAIDSTYIAVLGYFGKDFIFFMLFAVNAAQIIGRRKLYQIKMSNKFLHYSVLIAMGALQQCVATILCSLYPHSFVRMRIVYTSMIVNAVVCMAAMFELFNQRKLLKVQLDALFIHQSIEKKGNGVQVGMNRASLSVIDESKSKEIKD